LNREGHAIYGAQATKVNGNLLHGQMAHDAHSLYMALDSLATRDPRRHYTPAAPQTPQQYTVETKELRGHLGPWCVADYKGSKTPVNTKMDVRMAYAWAIPCSRYRFSRHTSS
jgi:hypothetical protein